MKATPSSIPAAPSTRRSIVIDGIPLTDNRSPGFGPEIEADDIESLSIYTAGFPAEYGRKMGGVIEVNTAARSPSPACTATSPWPAAASTPAAPLPRPRHRGQEHRRRQPPAAARTDHYLNPVVPQNYTNTGTTGDFSARYERELNAERPPHPDRPPRILALRHPQRTRPAGRRPAPDRRQSRNHGHRLRGSTSSPPSTLADAAAAWSATTPTTSTPTPHSTPSQVFQHNHFREGYFKATAHRSITAATNGKPASNPTTLSCTKHFNYTITDPTQFDPGTAARLRLRRPAAPTSNSPPSSQDLLHLGHWTIAPASAGTTTSSSSTTTPSNPASPSPATSQPHGTGAACLLRPRLSDARPSRTSSSPAPPRLSRSTPPIPAPARPALRRQLLRRRPRQGHLRQAPKLDVNYFRRCSPTSPTTISSSTPPSASPSPSAKPSSTARKPSSTCPHWRSFSGFASYSYMVGNAGSRSPAASSSATTPPLPYLRLSGHFPDSQDQRNTVADASATRSHPRLWLAGGVRIRLRPALRIRRGSRHRPRPVRAAGPRPHQLRPRPRPIPLSCSTPPPAPTSTRSERFTTTLQADGENLNNVLDVIDFGGLFSGNAIGPPRSGFLRLTTTF